MVTSGCSSPLISARLDLELKDHEGSTALWLALQYITLALDDSVNPFEDSAPVVNGTTFDESSLAAQLIQRGSNPNAPDLGSGTTAPPEYQDQPRLIDSPLDFGCLP